MCYLQYIIIVFMVGGTKVKLEKKIFSPRLPLQHLNIIVYILSNIQFIIINFNIKTVIHV